MREERITIRPFEELQVEHYEGLKQVKGDRHDSV